MTAGSVYWPGDDETRPAPGPLALIQALVNTLERPDGQDRLDDHADARPWLVDHGLLGPDAELTEADLNMVRGVRESLRALLVRNGGGSWCDMSACGNKLKNREFRARRKAQRR